MRWANTASMSREESSIVELGNATGLEQAREDCTSGANNERCVNQYSTKALTS